jgi:phosphatidylserine/phosphatidylglycerophosphate/cardiolipin synthase-like enzyme
MRNLRLLKHAILMTFAKMVYYNQNRVYRLWLVTPWISTVDEGADSISLLIEALRRQRCDVVVITRPPKEVWHLKGEQLLEKELNAVVYHCPSLHTKLYIAECNGFRGAVLGSPNLTLRANELNREIAVEFRTTTTGSDNEIGIMINQLIDYASSLREERDVTLKSAK